MLASITPLGERGRQRSWWTTVVAFTVASVAGGATTGALFGGVGAAVTSVVDLPVAWLLVVALLVAAAAEVGWLPFALPTIRRQVNEDWLDEYRGWVVGAGFGYQLGAAFLTIVTSASVYVTFLAALLTGSVSGGATIGAVFGLARALPLLAVRKVRTPESLASVHRTMERLAQPAHVVVAVWVVAMAAVTVGVS